MIVEKQQQSIDQLTLNKCSNVELPSYEELPTSKMDSDKINHVDTPEKRSKQDGRKNKSSQSDNTVCHISSPAKRSRSDKTIRFNH
jgi:hypothetical protein